MTMEEFEKLKKEKKNKLFVKLKKVRLNKDHDEDLVEYCLTYNILPRYDAMLNDKYINLSNSKIKIEDKKETSNEKEEKEKIEKKEQKENIFKNEKKEKINEQNKKPKKDENKKINSINQSKINMFFGLNTKDVNKKTDNNINKKESNKEENKTSEEQKEKTDKTDSDVKKY